MHSINKANFAILHWFGLNHAPQFTNLAAQLQHLYCRNDAEQYLLRCRFNPGAPLVVSSGKELTTATEAPLKFVA